MPLPMMNPCMWPLIWYVEVMNAWEQELMQYLWLCSDLRNAWAAEILFPTSPAS